ncbi:MAG: MoxR family ATPase [Cyanobacteria bacterium P01_F01_bin.150]
MTPLQLKQYLENLVNYRLKLSVMIWGPPGIGKSSIVAQIAEQGDLDFIDLRLSQLAPTDLRGLPIADDGMAKWYPPEFLPQGGQGILFLDELNMAPPTMQGMAQQLILDRRVGSYIVPEGWFVWAAGNRKEDRAAVFEMPSPLANRFLHLQVEPDFDSFKAYALGAGIHEQILAFLSFRTTLLHKLEPQEVAWCSPRTWMMASELHRKTLDIAPAVGRSAAAEFGAFLKLYSALPSVRDILAGEGKTIRFPKEPSVRYAVTIALAVRATDAAQALNGFRWLVKTANPEWVQLFAVDLFQHFRGRGKMAELVELMQQDKSLQTFFSEFQALTAE